MKGVVDKKIATNKYHMNLIIIVEHINMIFSYKMGCIVIWSVNS